MPYHCISYLILPHHTITDHTKSYHIISCHTTRCHTAPPDHTIACRVISNSDRLQSSGTGCKNQSLSQRPRERLWLLGSPPGRLQQASTVYRDESGVTKWSAGGVQCIQGRFRGRKMVCTLLDQRGPINGTDLIHGRPYAQHPHTLHITRPGSAIPRVAVGLA